MLCGEICLTHERSILFSAIDGLDYIGLQSSQMFASGSENGTTLCVTISMVNDYSLERDETFALMLTTMDPNDRVMVQVNRTTITITDNDGWFA